VAKDLPPHPLAFCGIARPQGFFAQLRKTGADPAAEVVFPDHHAYTEKDLRDLQFVAEQNQAGGFVTTEKDAVNLGGYLASLKPLSIVPVKMDLADASQALDFLLDTLKNRGRPVS
jgi:tetraacyldisaccharide 4'-kinase